MKTIFIKTIKISIGISYILMTFSLLGILISYNQNIFNNGTNGITTLFLCFTLTILMGIILIKINNEKT